jgi:hypothetical protein
MWAIEKGTYCPTIVPDVRFPNEVKAIQDMGGIVVRLTRNPVKSDDETETALDDYSDFDMAVAKLCEHNRAINFNYIIDNAKLTVEETNEICLKIAKEYINE